MKRIALAALSTLSALWLFPALAFADDWPQWRGPDRTGISKETGLLKEWPAGGPKQLWLIDTPGAGFAAPAIVGDRIYITGSIGSKEDRQGVLYGIDSNGKILFETNYGPEWGQNYENSRSTPTIVGDDLYLVSGTLRVVCLDRNTGKIKWSVDAIKTFKGQNIRWGIAESPLVVDGKVICHPGGKNAAVAALDAATGKTIWTSKGLSDESSYCSPIAVDFAGRKLLLTQTADHIVGIDMADGTVLWKVGQRNRYGVHPNTPVFFDSNKVFISCGYKYGCQLLELGADGKSAKVLWKKERPDNHFQGALLIDGRIYASSSNGPLYCLDPKTGDAIYKVDEIGKAAILYADERLYAYDVNNGGNVTISELKPGGYEMKGSFKVEFGDGPHWAHPVVANGVLYIRHGTGFAAYSIAE